MPEKLLFVGTSDLAGLVRGKAFPEADLEDRVTAGVGLTGSNIMLSAFGPIYGSPFGTRGDLKLVPDMSTRTAIPTSTGATLELVLGDICNLDGSPWSCCPRALLRRALDTLAAEFGLTLLSAFEQEFVYTGVAERLGSAYAFDRYRRAGTLGGRISAALRDADIIPDSFLPEYGERQFELTVKPRSGVRAADDAVLVREIIRGCSDDNGARAILAPVLKPDGIGNGTHIHFSLRDNDERPVMYAPGAALGISAVAQPFVAGIIEHMPALTAITAPSVASYFRLRPNKWAPTWANIGERDRAASLRVCPIFARDALSAASRFNLEYRIADATASPFLALSAIVYAGLDGLRRGLLLPAHADTDPAAAGIAQLPASLSAALDLLEASEAVRTWLGPDLCAAYLMFKRSEIAAVRDLSDDQICQRYAEVY